MTTPELFAQDEDVTHDKMQMQRSEKTKWPDGLDKKNDVEKKKKKRKKEHKTHKNEQKEETESETEPWAKNEEIETEAETCVKKDKEMEKQKKKKAKLSEGIDGDNCERGSDGGKEKKKKKQKTEDSRDNSLYIKKEKKKKKTKYVEGGSQENVHEGGDGLTENEDIGDPSERLSPKGSSNYERGPDGGKEKMKKKKKQKTEDSKESSSHIKEEKKRKKTKYVEGGSQEKVHGGGIGLTENEDIGGPSERLSPEGSSNRKRGPDGGKEKKKKKQKTEDSRDNSLHIKKEKKKKKTKNVEGASQEKVCEGGAGLTENVDVVGPSERPSPKGSSKKVRFSEDVEIFPIADGKSRKKTKQEDDGKSRKNTKQEDDGLIRGKRFSKEEDEIVKTAVMQYIHEHGLGDEGLKKVLKCREFPELKNCWKDIGKSLPYRPYLSVYYRAHILFERDESRKWTPEEYEIVRKFHEKYGSDWKGLADALGKHRFHVKDTWRRIKLTNMKKGRWTQDEYQKLFDLVNTDLRNKASEEKISKHGMLRDNICWGAISDKLATRSNALCCMKWYRQLTSPMVAEGDWEDVDDYRLVDALSSLDAVSIEDVEWDQLLEHRDGDICRKRWSQMVKHIGDNGNKSFSEQVELLSKRYSIDVLEAREAFDAAPIVD